MAPKSFIRSVDTFDKSTALSAKPGTMLALYINGDFTEFVPEGMKVKTPLLAGWLPERVRKEYTVYALERGVVEIPIAIRDLEYDGLTPTLKRPNDASHDVIQPIPLVTLTASVTLLESKELLRLLQTSPDIDSQLLNAVMGEIERIVRAEVGRLSLIEVRAGQYLAGVNAAIAANSSGFPIKLQSIAFNSWTWPEVLDVLVKRVSDVENTKSELLRNDMVSQNTRDQEMLDTQQKIYMANLLNIPKAALVNPELYSALAEAELRRQELAGQQRVALEQALTERIRVQLEPLLGPGGGSKASITREILQLFGPGNFGPESPEVTSNDGGTDRGPLVLEGEVEGGSLRAIPLSIAARVARSAADIGLSSERLNGCALTIAADRQRGEAIVVGTCSSAELDQLRECLTRENHLRDVHLTYSPSPDPVRIVQALLEGSGNERITLDEFCGITTRIEGSTIYVDIAPRGSAKDAARAVRELNSPESLQATCLSQLFDCDIVFTLHE